MNQTALLIIRIIHIVLIGMTIIVPWLNNPMLNCMYFISIPFLLLHWVTNNDTCVLSIIERVVRGLDDKKDCFICTVLEPVFKVNHLPMSELLYVISIGLWSYVCYNIWHRSPLIWEMLKEVKSIVLKYGS